MIRPLCPALQEKAVRELFENPDRIPSDIKTIREWLEKQPHLHAVKPTDQWILSFLRGNKFSLERTKEKLDMYYALRSIVPEILQERNPFDQKIQEILKLGVPLEGTLIFTLPSMEVIITAAMPSESPSIFSFSDLINKFIPSPGAILYLPLREVTAEDGCRICVTRFGLHDPNKYHMMDVLKVIIMIIEILIFEDDNFIISGEDLFVDIKGVGFGTFSQWTPTVAKKILFCVEKALPVRMKSNHMINITPGFEAAYAVFRAFVSEKLKSRICVYGKNYEDLYKVIPRYILPRELGGETSSVQELTDHWKAKVESYSDWFLNEEERSDESMRPEKPRSSSSLFGVEGSFRKLEVD